MHRESRRILLVLALGSCVAIVHAALSLGMAENVHLRYGAHAFPTVLSAMFHGLPWDYTAYEGVARIAIEGYRAAQAASEPMGDAVLRSAAELSEFDRSIRFLPFDDKGYVVLAWLGFSLFGLSVASVFWAYALLFGASVGAYLLALWDDITALVMLNVLLVGIYAAVFAFPVSTELGEITNPRAIGLLSIVALAHLLYVAIRGARLNPVGAGMVLVQSGMLVFVVFCRSSEAWQIGLVILFALIALRRAWLRKLSARPQLILIGALLLSIGVLNIHQRVSFHPGYFTNYGQNRLMWHNVGIGFALNPQLAQAHNMTISDGAMFALVAERARQQGVHDEIFTDSDKLLSNPVRDFMRYEEMSREIVLSIMKEQPWQALLTFTVYKPKNLVSTFLNAMYDFDGERADYEVVYIDNRAERDAYLKFFRPLPWFVIAICGTIMSIVGLSRDWQVVAIIIGAIWIGSALPALASYPLYHVIGMMFGTTSTVFFAIALGGVILAAETIRGSLDRL